MSIRCTTFLAAAATAVALAWFPGEADAATQTVQIRPGAPEALPAAPLLPAPATAPALLPPDASLPDTLYWRGREALNRREYREAARLFSRLREEHPDSEHLRDAYYYEALARSRTEEASELEEALRLLDALEGRFASRASSDAGDLRRRVEAARRDAGLQCAEEEVRARTAALNALRLDEPEEALSLYRELFRSDDPCHRALRPHILTRVARLGTPEALDLLEEVILRDPSADLSLRESAVTALRQVHDPAAVQLLSRVLAETEPAELHGTALQALGRHPAPEAREVLRRLIASTDTPREIRLGAVSQLGRGPGTVSVIRSAAGAGLDAVALRQGIAEVTISGFGSFPGTAPPPEDQEFLREIYRTTADDELRERIFTTLGATGRPVDFLIQVAREDPSAERRQAAIRYLGRSDDPRAQEFLAEVVRSGLPR